MTFAIDKSGKKLAIALHDGSLMLWDIIGDKRQATFSGPRRRMASVSFSADGRLVATGSYQVITLWNVSTAKEIKSIAAHEKIVERVAFTPNGKLLVSAAGDWQCGVVKVWDVASGKNVVTHNAHGALVTGCAVSPDGTLVGTGSLDKAVKLWRLSVKE